MKKNNSNGAACKAVTNSIREINKLHGSIIQAARTSLTSAIRIGELLAEIKNNSEHGEWTPWVEANLPFSYRTAARYIRVFEERGQLGKLDSVSSLGEAYALLSDAKPEPLVADEIALAPEVFQRFNNLSPDNRLVVETALTVFYQQGRAVTPDDVVGLIDRLEVARN